MFLRFKSNIPDGRVYDECRRFRCLKCELKCSLKCSLSESAEQSYPVIYVIMGSCQDREDKE